MNETDESDDELTDEQQEQIGDFIREFRRALETEGRR